MLGPLGEVVFVPHHLHYGSSDYCTEISGPLIAGALPWKRTTFFFFFQRHSMHAILYCREIRLPSLVSYQRSGGVRMLDPTTCVTVATSSNAAAYIASQRFSSCPHIGTLCAVPSACQVELLVNNFLVGLCTTGLNSIV